MEDFFTCQLEDICRRAIPRTINGICIVYAINVITYTELDTDTDKPIDYVDITIDITHKNRSFLKFPLFDVRVGHCIELFKLSNKKELSRVKNKLKREIKHTVSNIIELLNIQDFDI